MLKGRLDEGGVRLCCDCCYLNKYIRGDAYPTPDIFNRLATVNAMSGTVVDAMTHDDLGILGNDCSDVLFCYSTQEVSKLVASNEEVSDVDENKVNQTTLYKCSLFRASNFPLQTVFCDVSASGDHISLGSSNSKVDDESLEVVAEAALSQASVAKASLDKASLDALISVNTDLVDQLDSTNKSHMCTEPWPNARRGPRVLP